MPAVSEETRRGCQIPQRWSNRTFCEPLHVLVCTGKQTQGPGRAIGASSHRVISPAPCLAFFFFHGFWKLTSNPPVWKASALETGLSPQALHWVKYHQIFILSLKSFPKYFGSGIIFHHEGLRSLWAVAQAYKFHMGSILYTLCCKERCDAPERLSFRRSKPKWLPSRYANWHIMTY